MTNDKWINFPKNPYEGQIFYYPDTKDTFTYVIPKKYPENVYLDDKGEWVPPENTLKFEEEQVVEN